MPDASYEPTPVGQPWSVQHPVTPADKTAMAAMRTMIEPNKGRLQGLAARGPFDAIMNRVIAPAGVTYEADTVGGVSGWWCCPETVRPGEGTSPPRRLVQLGLGPGLPQFNRTPCCPDRCRGVHRRLPFGSGASISGRS